MSPLRPIVQALRGLLPELLLLALAIGGSPLLGAAQGEPPEAASAGAERERQSRLLVDAFQQPDGWSEAGEYLLARLIAFLPSLLAAILVLVAFFLLYRVVAGVLHGLLRRTHADPAVQEVLLRLTKFVFLGFGMIMAVNQLGIAVGSVLAGLGIVGVAVGLAAQDSLGNLVAGITILWDRPFRIGDNVTIAGTFGRVQEIGLRATTLLTVERKEAIFPNKQVINEEIVNHTRNGELRLGIPVGVGYGENLREVRRVLLAAVDGHPRVLAEPAPRLVVTGLSESSVDLELRVFLRDPHEEREAFFELIELAKRSLDEAGIEIPFPQRTLHAGRELLAALAAPGRGGGARSRRETPVEGEAGGPGTDVAGWDEVDH